MGGFADDEIPLLVMLFYLFRGVEPTRSYRGLHMRLQKKNPFVLPSYLQRSVSGLVAPYPSALDGTKTRGLRSCAAPYMDMAMHGASSSLERSPAKSILPGRVRIFTYEPNAVGNREPALARRRL